MTRGTIEALRDAIHKTKPWEKAKGPVTPEGKANSRRAVLKHGKRTKEAWLTWCRVKLANAVIQRDLAWHCGERKFEDRWRREMIGAWRLLLKYDPDDELALKVRSEWKRFGRRRKSLPWSQELKDAIVDVLRDGCEPRWGARTCLRAVDGLMAGKALNARFDGFLIPHPARSWKNLGKRSRAGVDVADDDGYKYTHGEEDQDYDRASPRVRYKVEICSAGGAGDGS